MIFMTILQKVIEEFRKRLELPVRHVGDTVTDIEIPGAMNDGCICNSQWFSGKLPYIHVGWDRERFDKCGVRDKAAVTEMYRDNRDCRIVFNPLHRLPFAKFDSGLDITMLHEQIHVKLSEYQCNSRADLHGRRFKAERQRLIDAGAFTELL
jgi:hypothetical protein